MNAQTQSPTRGRRSKVARLIEEYNLQGFGEELEEKWTTNDSDRCSLRKLADQFNKKILKQAMDDQGVKVLNGEVENTYRLLSDGSVSSDDRTRTRRQLEREGVDVEALEDDFVSYGAIRTYLKNHRGVSYTQDDGDRLEKERKNIQQLQSRTSTVTESKIEELQNAGHITNGEYHTLVDVRVVCDECKRQFDISEFFSEASCDCK